jgi:hypothetical protein
LPGHDLVHADEEYATGGKFNYEQPDKIEEVFGRGALLSAMTSGHFLARHDLKLVEDMRKTVGWIRKNPSILNAGHDQSFLNVASLVGNWKMLNLCKPPHNWLSSWAGDYQNPPGFGSSAADRAYETNQPSSFLRRTSLWNGANS